MAEANDYLGYIKYTGKMVDGGYMDARKSAQALIGLDEALRFFVRLEQPEFANIDFEIPVRVRKGSWEALIPQTIGQWFVAALGMGATAYVVKAAQKMAGNDFSELGFKTAIRSALIALQWVVRISKHLGTLTKKKFENVIFRNNNEEVGITNEKMETLYVPKKYLDFYTSTSPLVLSKISELVEEERKLSIGLEINGNFNEEHISMSEKSIFAKKVEEDDTLILPELIHGKYIDLEGEITRGNENSNTLGLRYKDHILTCTPVKGSIVKYKQALFVRGRIKGTIDRNDRFGNPIENKPKILFDDLEAIDDDSNYSLF
jgi:hypothetical protein